MIQTFTKSKWVYLIPAVILVFFSVWWLYLRSLNVDSVRDARQLWGATYQILALYGGIIGTFISYKWGGHRSLLGRVILAFSIGLFLQCFGQTYSSYYVFHYHVESPSYPGIGDFGFFGSVIAYIYGALALSKVSGIGVSLKKIQNKAWALLIPVIILVASYLFFLKGYEFDFSQKIKIMLDFGYPFGQAFYVSIAILALIMSKNVLGGVMKRPMLLLIFALLFQYFSDFFFLYQANAGTWYVGNINDYLYCASYFIMTISLIQIGKAFYKIQNS
jgi:hypothetical protein